MRKVLSICFCLILLSIYACKESQMVSVKLMSYNIHHGEGMDAVLDLSRIDKIIKTHAPDLVGLQEVDYFCMRSDSIDQVDYLANQTTMKGTFGKFMDFQGGAYGLATLSGLPLISTNVLVLPDGKYEPRSSVIHEVQVADECVVTFANVHFDWIEDEEGSANRLNQAKALVAYLDTLNRATIIIGDFNCIPGSPTMQYFQEQGFYFIEKGEDNLSFQGDTKMEIDHVIYRNMGGVKFNEKSIQLLDEPITSDHRPLVAEIEVIF